MNLLNRVAVVCLTAGMISSPALARDADSAKGYVKEAKELIDSRDFEGAFKKIELAEAELDGVDAGSKSAIEKSIAEIKEQIASVQAAGDKDKYTRRLDRVMTEAEGSIGNLVTWPGAERDAKELFEDPIAKAALGADLAKAQAKFATFKKLHTKKAAVQISAQVDDEMKQFDEKWEESKKVFEDKDASPNSKSSAGEDMIRAIESARKSISQLAEDDAKAKALTEKLNGIETQVVKLALADQAKEKLETLQRDWDSYAEEWKGYDTESAGPSFAEYSKESSESMYALKCPKTKALLTRANQWLENRKDDESFKTLQAVPEIKAFGENILKLRDAALAKMEKNADAILADAEKAIITADNIDRVNTIKDGLKNNIEGSAKLEAFEARAQKIISKFEKATTGAADAQMAAYKEMTEKAAADWLAMKAKYSPVDGFDPNKPADFKGKTIIITTDNLMGYRFKPGDFKFATTLNGIAIAGKYDPAVAKAIEEVEAKIGRSLGDSDDDGKWEIIATVDGTTGKMLAKKEATGDVTVDGQKVGTVTSEYSEPVTAPIITIIAAHCGPLAVSKE